MSVVAVKAIQVPLLEAQAEVKKWCELAMDNSPFAGALADVLRLLEVAALACQDAVDEAGTLSELETARD